MTSARSSIALTFAVVALLHLVAGVALFPVVASTSVKPQSGWVASRHGVRGQDLNAVFFIDSKRGWVAGDGGFISKTEDGGISWAQQKLDTIDAINDIFFKNKDEGFLLASGRIFGTTDGGQTWSVFQTFTSHDFDGALPELYSIRFSNKKKGWIVGSLSRKQKNGETVVVDSLVLKTTDGGGTWQRQSIRSNQELIHVAFVNEKHGWIVGSAGSILHTVDGGENWERQRSRTDATLFHVDFRSEKRGWVVGERSTILRTVDGGETWTSSAPTNRATFLSVQFINEDEGWVVGRGGTLLHSDDGGLTWQPQNSGTQRNLFALYIDKKDGWAVGADGLVLHYFR